MNNSWKLIAFRGSSSLLIRPKTSASSFLNGSSKMLMHSCPCGGNRTRTVTKVDVGVAKVSQLLRSSISNNLVLCRSLASSAVSSPSPVADGAWDLYAGIVVERKPILTQKKDALQEKYSKYLSQIEFELSKKSDHEIRLQNDVVNLEKVKAGELDLGNTTTARDDEDRWIAEAQEFVPASRETEADSKKDFKSLERALDSHLLLLVEQKLGNDYKWICPHSKLEPGENLREAAERMLRNTFPEMKTKILGNAPWGFYRYKYPASANAEKTGAKVFFCKAQIISGEPSLSKESKEHVKDFLWLKRDELPGKLTDEYYKKLSDCLIDE